MKAPIVEQAVQGHEAAGLAVQEAAAAVARCAELLRRSPLASVRAQAERLAPLLGPALEELRRVEREERQQADNLRAQPWSGLNREAS